jgi:hypothetical protein
MNLTMNQLFDLVTETIAGSGAEIKESHKKKAVLIFTYFDEFLLDHYEGIDESIKDDIDFTAYATKILDELEGKK